MSGMITECLLTTFIPRCHTQPFIWTPLAVLS
jgi:hypothetical protein